MFRLYRQITGQNSIPRTDQYWCLAGKLVDKNGTLQPLCEPLQAIRAGLIQPEQYFGVEIDPVRAAANRTQKDQPLQLIEGDIVTAIRGHIREKTFRGALLNLDTAHEPKEAVKLLARVYRELKAYEGPPPVMFLNLLITRWYQAKQYSDAIVIDQIQKQPHLADESRRGMLATGWKIACETHEYFGASTAARSRMKIYAFFRHDCDVAHREICFAEGI